MPSKIMCRNGRTIILNKRIPAIDDTVAKPLARPGSGVVLGGVNNQINKVQSVLRSPSQHIGSMRAASAINTVHPTVPTSVTRRNHIIEGKGLLGDIKVSKISKKNRNNLVLKIA